VLKGPIFLSVIKEMLSLEYSNVNLKHVLRLCCCPNFCTAAASNYACSVFVASFQENENEISLFWDFAQGRLVVGNRRLRKISRCRLQGSLKMGPIGLR